MITGFVQIHDCPSHKRIEAGLLDLIFKLRARIPDCSRGIMKKGWRSPIGDWTHKNFRCPELNELKAHVHGLLPPSTWDFFTWFEIVEVGGTVSPHVHLEHTWTVHYQVRGNGSMMIEQGKKGAWISLIPGEILIVPAIAKNSSLDPATEQRISVVLNANRVVSL